MKRESMNKSTNIDTWLCSWFVLILFCYVFKSDVNLVKKLLKKYNEESIGISCLLDVSNKKSLTFFVFIKMHENFEDTNVLMLVKIRKNTVIINKGM